MRLEKIAQAAALVKEGARIVVLADFDHTLSRPGCPITHRVFPTNAHSMGLTLGEQFDRMDKRNTFPLQATHSLDEKKRICTDWWNESHKHIVNAGFSMHNLPTYIDHANITLRKNFGYLSDLINEKRLPFVVVSAGIEEVIREILHDFKIATLQIAANKFVTDNAGKIVDFGPTLIHSYNKDGPRFRSLLNDPTILDGEYVVVLLGDSLGDLIMLEGIKPRLAYTIGFCNKPSQRKEFEAAFDLVLDRDAGMETAAEVLLEMLGKRPVSEHLPIEPRNLPF
ncbi:unnamed protein product, partial [Mesorhabditis spiculigera]